MKSSTFVHSHAGPLLIAGILGLILAIGWGCGSSGGADEADLVLHNGNVFTARDDGAGAQAVAIRADKIVAVGTDAQVLAHAGEDTEVIDLAGRTVIPGFNDAHMHVQTYGADRSFFVGPEPPLELVLSQVESLSSQLPAGGSISGQIGSFVLDDPRASRYTLDTVAPDQPVYLVGFTGHGSVFNTALMDFVGLAEDEPNPLGGFFARDPASGILTGKAHEYAQGFIERRLAALLATPESSTAVYRALDDLFAQRGITSVQLMATAEPTVATARALIAADPKVRWRIIRVPMTTDSEFPLDDVDGLAELSHPRVTVSGLKWILDGTPIERFASFREPYTDRPDTSGEVNFSDEWIQAMLRSALEAGEQPMFHVVGDNTHEVLLDAMEEVADSATWQRVRVRFEHGDGLTPDLFERARSMGVVVVQNPLHFNLTELFDERLGEERVAQLSPLRSLQEEGIAFALGTDAPIGPADDVMYAVVHDANPAEALTREQAVVAHTRGGAYAEHAETEKGTLAVGMLADLAILSQDIFSVPLEEVPATRSVLTIIGGEIAYRDADF